VACALGPGVNLSSTDFSVQNLVFWNLIEFSTAEITSKSNLPHSESKSYQINCIKSWSSRSFHNTEGTFQFLQNFQLWFNLIFSEKMIQYTRTSTPQVQMPWNQADAPSSSRAFQRDLEHDLKHPGLVDLISTNKLPSFIDRLSVIIKGIGYRFTKHKHGAGKSPLGVPFSKMLGEFFFHDTHRIPIKCHEKKKTIFLYQ